MRRHSSFSIGRIVLAISGLLVFTFVVLPIYLTIHRENAEWPSCQHNLRQVMLAMQEYVGDHNDMYPPLYQGHMPITNPPSDGWVNLLQPNLVTFQNFQCPDEMNLVPGQTDYAYNSPVVAGREETKFAHSAQTVLLCEGNETDGFRATASGPVIANRHMDGSNYAFVDGHVKWLLSTKSPYPSDVAATATNFTFGR